MKDDFSVTLGEHRYRWLHDPAKRDPGRSWEWVYERSNEVIESPDALVDKLNQAFGEQCLCDFLRSTETHEAQRCIAILESMGLAQEALVNVDEVCVSHNVSLQIHRLVSSIKAIQAKRREDMVQGSHPFNDSVLRDWLTENHRPRFDWLTSEPVVATGWGPFHPADFGVYLEELELQVQEEPDPEVGVLVVGRQGWNRELIDRQIEDRTGATLHVVSQEMLIATVLSGKDPFEADGSVLERFRSGHPGLEFVSEGWPGWVQVWVQPRSASSGKREYTKWEHNESLLAVCGYHVGKTSQLTREQRHAILDFAFRSASIPPHCADWGSAGSGARLKAMAYHIKWLVESNAAETRKDMSVAVKDWRDDLAWLKDRFYRGHMKFGWPDPEVG